MPSAYLQLQTPEAQDGRIHLLRADAEFRRAIPPEQRHTAERLIVVTARQLAAGTWDTGAALDGHDPSTLALVIDGIIAMEITLAGTPSAHLWATGDLIQPWQTPSTVLSTSARWTVGQEGARIAMLDGTFGRAERKWPELAVTVRQRMAEQTCAMTVRVAIASLPRIEQRVLALFWHLAERWGRMQPDGVLIPLALTHELIGRLVGGKRPTVSLALAELAESGMLESVNGAGWRLAADSAALLDGQSVARAALRPPAWLRS